ncbi:myb/SANT-like DNA-binding domain-containing protein 1 [Ornithodoros turicata]
MAAALASSRDFYCNYRTRSRTSNWGDAETHRLIDLWQIFRVELQQTKRRRHIFEEMSRRLLSLGFKRDANEIQGRITNLAYLYRREGKMKLVDPSRAPWKFWDHVHKVLHGSSAVTHLNQVPTDSTPDVSQQEPGVNIVCRPEIPSYLNGENSEDSSESGQQGVSSGRQQDMLMAIVEQQRLLTLEILNDERRHHEERLRILLDMEDRLKKEHNEFKLALVDRLNSGFAQIISAIHSTSFTCPHSC